MSNREHGFTIIETVLFLAVTGLVLSVILVGIGNSLRAERYRDSLNQTLDFFQGQYSKAANIANDRPEDASCSSSTGIVESGGIGRGTSDCLILGRSVRSEDGQKITVRQVVARADVGRRAGMQQKSDSEVFAESLLEEGDVLQEYSIEWGGRLMASRSANNAKFSLLIVRSPVYGVIHTYVDPRSSTTPVLSLLSREAPSEGTKFCVDPSGFFNLGIQPAGVVIDQNAMNASGVRQVAAGEC